MNELAIAAVLVLFTWCIGLNAWLVRGARRMAHPSQNHPHAPSKALVAVPLPSKRPVF